MPHEASGVKPLECRQHKDLDHLCFAKPRPRLMHRPGRLEIKCQRVWIQLKKNYRREAAPDHVSYWKRRPSSRPGHNTVADVPREAALSWESLAPNVNTHCFQRFVQRQLIYFFGHSLACQSLKHIRVGAAEFLLRHGNESTTETIAGSQGPPSLANLCIKTPLITRGWKLYFQRLFDGVSCCAAVVQPFLQRQWPTNSQLLWNLSGWHWKRVREAKNGRRPSNSHCLPSVTPFFPSHSCFAWGPWQLVAGNVHVYRGQGGEETLNCGKSQGGRLWKWWGAARGEVYLSAVRPEKIYHHQAPVSLSISQNHLVVSMTQWKIKKKVYASYIVIIIHHEFPLQSCWLSTKLIIS